jgi:hypothetical protein
LRKDEEQSLPTPQSRTYYLSFSFVVVSAVFLSALVYRKIEAFHEKIKKTQQQQQQQ